MLPSYEALIFDMDGVLIDSEPLHEQAQRVVFSRYKLTVPSSIFTVFKGKTEQDVFGHVVETYAEGRLDASELIALKHAVYSELIENLQPIPGALPLLERLAQRRIPLGLTTSATRRDQERAFARFDLHRFFEVVVTVEDVQRPKPDPEPYLTTARRMGFAPASCLVIEDSTNGVQAALRAGCTVAGIATSFTTAQLLEAGAHVAADRYEELTPYLFPDAS